MSPDPDVNIGGVDWGTSLTLEWLALGERYRKALQYLDVDQDDVEDLLAFARS